MSFRLGLTGSIGMGKSTTAAMLADAGCAVWDADAAVGRLYGPGGAALPGLAELVPDSVTPDGVDRAGLRAAIQADGGLLARIEAIVHPLVRADREDFARASATRIAVFDIPLLFETGAETEMDAVACVTVSAQLQRDRVLERGTMSASDLDTILARQMPNAQKCARADYVIRTETMAQAREDVAHLLASINDRSDHA